MKCSMLYFVVCCFFECSLMATLIERFERHIAFMHTYNGVAITCLGDCPMIYFGEDFTNQHICACMKALQLEKSFTPLLQGWEQELEKNEDFLKEYACLALYTYDALAYARARVSLFDLLGLYLQISSLPLPQLLDALDDMAHQLEIIFENYPLEEKFTWNLWFDTYWWVPAFGSVWVIYTCVRWYKNKKTIKAHASY